MSSLMQETDTKEVLEEEAIMQDGALETEVIDENVSDAVSDRSSEVSLGYKFDENLLDLKNVDLNKAIQFAYSFGDFPAPPISLPEDIEVEPELSRTIDSPLKIEAVKTPKQRSLKSVEEHLFRTRSVASHTATDDRIGDLEKEVKGMKGEISLVVKALASLNSAVYPLVANLNLQPLENALKGKDVRYTETFHKQSEPTGLSSSAIDVERREPFITSLPREARATSEKMKAVKVRGNDLNKSVICRIVKQGCSLNEVLEKAKKAVSETDLMRLLDIPVQRIV